MKIRPRIVSCGDNLPRALTATQMIKNEQGQYLERLNQSVSGASVIVQDGCTESNDFNQWVALSDETLQTVDGLCLYGARPSTFELRACPPTNRQLQSNTCSKCYGSSTAILGPTSSTQEVNTLNNPATDKQ